MKLFRRKKKQNEENEEMNIPMPPMFISPGVTILSTPPPIRPISEKIFSLEKEMDEIDRKLEGWIEVPGKRPSVEEREKLQKRYEELSKEIVDYFAQEADKKFLRDSLT